MSDVSNKNPKIDLSLRGVDVSAYQGTVDWTAAQKDGIRFAMVKATQGRSLSDPNLRNFTDSRFASNVTGAAAAGIVCGAYHYLTAQNEAEAVSEADVFLAAVRPYRAKLALGAAVDVEDSRLPRDRGQLTAIVRTFCQRVRASGMEIMVYTNPDFLRNRLDDLTEYGLWLALWRDQNNPPTTDRYPNLRIWQWGSAPIRGIAGKPDANFGVEGLLLLTKPAIDYAAEVQRMAGLADVTMRYLSMYQYGDDLLKKLYGAMVKEEDKT